MNMLGSIRLLLLLILHLLAPSAGYAQTDLPQSRIEAAAPAADPWAVYIRAQNHEQGKAGVKRSWTKARALYEEATRGGAIEVRRAAAFALGNHYVQPGSQNFTRAARYFQHGSELNDPWATFKLAELYEKGRGVKKSSRRARDFYLKVAAGGNADASKYAYLALGRLHMRRPLLNNASATDYFQKALSRGEVWSAYFLMEIYGQKKRTKATRAQMREYLSVLQRSGDKKARAAARTLAKRYGIPAAS